MSHNKVLVFSSKTRRNNSKLQTLTRYFSSSHSFFLNSFGLADKNSCIEKHLATTGKHLSIAWLLHWKHLAIGVCIAKHLAIGCCIEKHLAIGCCIGKHLAIGSCIGNDLPLVTILKNIRPLVVPLKTIWQLVAALKNIDRWQLHWKTFGHW